MIYHVLPGESLVGEFKKTNIEGEVIVCRECLVVGDIDAETLPEFWDQRARFVLSEYAEDEIEYHDKVADELSRLADMTADDEVNLWFEYELFCSVNMWFCLWLLHETGAAVYRVEPIGLKEEDRWDGFGKVESDDLKACFELRTECSGDDIALGAALWRSYRQRDYAALQDLARTVSPGFPFLDDVVAAATTQDTQPIEVLRAILEGGKVEPENIFVEFKRRAGVYGYGDLQVQSLLDQLSS